MLILFQIQNVPVVLGPVGFVLMFIYSVAATGISIYFFWKRSEVGSLQSNVKAQADELSTLRPRMERLATENLALERQNAELKTRTDLESIIKTSNTLMQVATESLELTRMNQVDTQKFEKENTTVHLKLVTAIDDVIRTGAERYQRVVDGMEALTNQQAKIQQEMARHFDDDRNTGKLIYEALEKLLAKGGS